VGLAENIANAGFVYSRLESKLTGTPVDDESMSMTLPILGNCFASVSTDK
jgi:hypothetical protein